MRAAVAAGHFTGDDFVISWAAHACGIPLLESSEICSRWRRTVTNDQLHHAVTHPHKLPRWLIASHDALHSVGQRLRA